DCEEDRRGNSARSALPALSPRVGLSLKPAPDQQCHARQRRNRVVLLARREAEEGDNHHYPECEQQISPVSRIELRSQLSPVGRDLFERLWQKRTLGQQP